MMGWLSVIMRNNFFFFSRRTYASAASDGIRIIASNGPALKNKASDASDQKVTGNNFPMTNKQLREVFWMKDPTTGFWMPENHFDEVDVAELRRKLLYNKQG
ncbi:protein SENESCENCE-ASSOCIATED GENE 21, mitochondrial-like [Chenopodium quinoa]|uniref:Uncharacterized protein n=1 Tax=Chenopodium quinoa TaxID=63459 RepID=A0A803M9P7_CHEQI|nr:protein SENESCENCE-ASSOCIATED GENE 21, mitochondrial-like [Chenopodium quinoa]